MTARVVILATPREAPGDAPAQYAEGVQPLLKAAGASLAVRGPVVAGDAGAPKSITVLEFPDSQKARDFFGQDAYRALIPLRDASFAQMDIHIVEG